MLSVKKALVTKSYYIKIPYHFALVGGDIE